MIENEIRVAVLTISDGVHHGTRIDKSGPALVERLRAQPVTPVSGPEVLPDERQQIAARLRQSVLARMVSDVVFTTWRYRRRAPGRHPGGRLVT